MMTQRAGILDLETRRRLFRYIQENPGMHLRGIARELNMPLGTVEYHLHQMERGGVLTTREEGRFKAFFAAEGIDRRDKDILYYVRQEMPRRVVLHLLEHPRATHSDVSAALPVGASTVSFHLKKLVAAGIVREERDGRTKHFQVVEPDRAAAVLIRYRKSFLDDLVDRFARIWFTMDAEGAATAPEGPAPREPPTPEGTRQPAAPDAPPTDAGDGGRSDVLRAVHVHLQRIGRSLRAAARRLARRPLSLGIHALRT